MRTNSTNLLMYFLTTRKKKYLLYAGLVILLITVPAIMLVNEYFDDGYKSSRLTLLDNLPLLFLLGVTVGPIAEEISFRGSFAGSKLLAKISYVAILLYIALSGNYYLIVLYLIFLAAVWFKKENTAYLLSSIIFSAIHFKLRDLSHLKEILAVIEHVGFSFILIWITVNFGIMKAILTHMAHNFIVMLPLFCMFQFPEQEVHRVTVKGYELSWNKVPVLSGKNTIFNDSYSIEARNSTVKKFCEFYDITSESYGITESNKYYKFNFSIRRVGATAGELTPQITNSLLLKASLIENNSDYYRKVRMESFD